MLVPDFVSILTRLASELAALHQLPHGDADSTFCFWDDLPTGGLHEYEAWESAATNLAASKLYALEMHLHTLLETGSSGERELVRSAQRGVFSPFWQFFMLRDDPARQKEPFPCDVCVPEFDFATNSTRELIARPPPTRATPWREVVSNSLGLFNDAIEALQALERIQSSTEFYERQGRWERFGRSKRVRVMEQAVPFVQRTCAPEPEPAKGSVEACARDGGCSASSGLVGPS